MFRRLFAPCSLLIAVVVVPALAGGRLDAHPRFDRYTFMRENQAKLVTGGTIRRVEWSEDGSTLTYQRDGETKYSVDLAAGTVAETGDVEESEGDGAGRFPGRGRRPARGRQRDSEPSPDGNWVAKSVDWNVVLERSDDLGGTIDITTTGTRKHRFGKASWVYGEELRQLDAMFWSPDSKRLAYYELDESGVPDFYLTGDLNTKRTEALIEGYPKPGEDNPIAKLWIYDLASGENISVDVGDDPTDYIFNIRFAPNGDELLFNRTNRHQNHLEVMAVDPATGEARLVVSEEQDTWQKNSPEIKFLEDGERFIWESESTGFERYQLRRLDGEVICELTAGLEYPANTISRVDEEAGYLYYTAYSDANPLYVHLHRVGLDGKGDTRLTTPGRSHTVQFSKEGKWMIDRAETIETPPTTSLLDAAGGLVAVLGESDSTMAETEGIITPELFTYQADDGTDLFGVVYKPSNFDPDRVYPLILDVYGGPLSKRVRARYRAAYPETEFGFIIAVMDNRGTTGRGKAFESAGYLKLGDVDIADQVAGVRHLTDRPYIDGERVGVFGHSYGGYMSALAITKFPGVFDVAVAGGTVVDWRQYDTIYTERFMRTPQENPEGYDEGSVLTYADQLEGKLLLLHGMVDDNVHPTNLWQLADALQKADKRFEMMLYPTRGHGLGRQATTARWEFLCEHLLGEMTPSAEPEPAVPSGS